jgi:hypothetical protein
MSDRIRIVSDGTAHGTRVLNADGEPIPGVTKIEIEPLEPCGIVRAKLTFHFVELDVVANNDEQ